MTPRGLLLVGSLVALAAVMVAAAGAAVQGPRPPSCGGLMPASECRDGAYWGGLALKALALPVGLYGGILVAMGLARRAAEEDAQAEAEAATQAQRPDAHAEPDSSSSPHE